jgi:hypothetical protein
MYRYDKDTQNEDLKTEQTIRYTAFNLIRSRLARKVAVSWNRVPPILSAHRVCYSQALHRGNERLEPEAEDTALEL